MGRSDGVLSTNRPGLARNKLVDFQYLRALGYAPYGGAAVGEVLHAVGQARRAGSNRAAVVDAWRAQGRHLHARAEGDLAAGSPTAARDRFLRAYNYLRVAEFFFDRHQVEEHRALYHESVAAFDRAIELLATPAESVEIPGPDGMSMPGYVFRPADDHEPRPTVVVMGGGDGHGEEMYFLAGVPALLERGYNAILFHAPGQRGLLHRDPTQVFRPDSESFLGSVVDHALEQPWVDPDRIALYGLSFGGYHVLRAAARDRRVAAVVASAPMPDMFGMLVEAAVDGLPRPAHAPAHRWLTGLSPRALDRALALPRRLNWAVEVMVDGYMLWTSGAPTAGEALAGLRRYRLGTLESDIEQPVLCLWASGEGPAIRRRIERFQATIAGTGTLAPLTPVDGADGHCGIGNVVHTAAIVCDWLDDTLGRAAMTSSGPAHSLAGA